MSDTTFITAERAKNLDLTTYVGRKGTINMDGLSVGIEVKEARVRFGHLDLLVTPLIGSGERWIESQRLSLTPA